jgi:hypothetical protein
MDARPITRAATAGLAYFAVVFVAGVALGVTRVLFIVPMFDATVAVLIELPIILALSWIACRRLIVRLEVSATTYARLAMGGLAFALLMVAEFAIAAVVFGRSLRSSRTLSRTARLTRIRGTNSVRAFSRHSKIGLCQLAGRS